MVIFKRFGSDLSRIRNQMPERDAVLNPASVKILYKNSTVVVFPEVPVTPTTFIDLAGNQYINAAGKKKKKEKQKKKNQKKKKKKKKKKGKKKKKVGWNIFFFFFPFFLFLFFFFSRGVYI